jgi:hypothetical protein
VNIKGFLISKEDEEATSLGTSLRPIWLPLGALTATERDRTLW